MNTQDQHNYERIAKSITYIKQHFKEQPLLDDIAESVHLSPYHFQRLFKKWAGVTPKKFLQYLSIEHAKKILKETDLTLFDTAFETGLSGTGRLHDLFVNIEGMTPGEYKNGGEQLHINYSFAQSPFGMVLIASTDKGICHLAFIADREKGVHNLKKHFPNATYEICVDQYQLDALKVFTGDWSNIDQLRLHLRGSEFQLKVWEALLKIPKGQLTSYGKVAQGIHKPLASRSVGTAIGNNPVAYLIPCHRVIQASGEIGNYMWGQTRKSAIIGWEQAQLKVNQ